MLKTVSSITNAIGALNYVGTWNASTNTPTLASGVGTKGDYYQVSVAGSTSINGISNWGVGDVIAFNGTTWQRIEGGADLNGVNLTVTGVATVQGLTVGKGGGAVSTSTVLGVNALASNASGTENTAIGNQSLNAATTSFNTIVGSRAGASTSTGQATAFGALALQNSTTGIGNVAVGGYDPSTGYQAALRSLVSGNYNTATGNGALTATTASGNTGFGCLAGYNITSGSDNVYVGYQSSASSATVTSEIAIGAGATGKGTNTAFIGGSAGAYNGANSATWAVTSDERVKKNIVDLDSSLDKILALRPVEFDYKTDGKHDVGFIAQKYAETFPDQVRAGDDGMLSINQNLVPYLVKAIQELHSMITQLQTQQGASNV